MVAPVNITASTAKLLALGDVASLRAGYPFRSAIQTVEDGDVLALQLKDFQGGARPDWANVTRTSLPRTPSQEEWLKDEDIVFAFRGTRFFAAILEHVPAGTVASTQFMLIRVKEPGVVLPAFLAWQLNQSPAREYFHRNSEGTAQRSLRRAVIAGATLAVPSHALQGLVVELVRLAERERVTLEELINIREQQLSRVAVDLRAVAEAKESK